MSVSTSTPHEHVPAVTPPRGQARSSRPLGLSTGAWIMNALLGGRPVVKVSVPDSSAVTKWVTTKVSAIEPGDTVTAVGTASNGVVKATSVRVGDTGLPAFRTRRRPSGRRPVAPVALIASRDLAWIAAPRGALRPRAIQASARRVGRYVPPLPPRAPHHRVATRPPPVRVRSPQRPGQVTLTATVKWHSRRGLARSFDLLDPAVGARPSRAAGEGRGRQGSGKAGCCVCQLALAVSATWPHKRSNLGQLAPAADANWHGPRLAPRARPARPRCARI